MKELDLSNGFLMEGANWGFEEQLIIPLAGGLCLRVIAYGTMQYTKGGSKSTVFKIATPEQLSNGDLDCD